MAFIRTCCCCCNLRTGVLVIGIFTIIGAGFSVATEIMTLRNMDNAREFFREHTDDSEKFGFSSELLQSVETMSKVGIGIASVSALSALMLMIPAGFTQRENARPFRGLLLVYVIWQVASILFSLGYGCWVLSKFTNPVVAAALIAGFGISIPLGIYFVIVVVAFFIELGEDPTFAGTVVVQQSTIPYANLPSESPPQYPAAYPPQQYTGYPGKQGIV